MKEELSITLGDLWALFKRKKGFIFKSAFAVSALAIFFAVTKPITYKVEATFRDRGKSSSGADPSQMMMVMMSGSSTENESSTSLKTYRILKPVVQKYGMQVRVSPDLAETSKFFAPFKHLWTELSHFQLVEEPIFSEPLERLFFTDVVYTGEKALVYQLTFLDDTHFTLVNNDKSSQGEMGRSLADAEVQFTINAFQVEQGKTYQITFRPLTPVVEGFMKQLKVEVDKKDKTLVKLKWNHTDRFLAPRILNEVMTSYQNFLSGESERLSTSQIDYLEKREGESYQKLELVMKEHADVITHDLANIGFYDAEKALHFYAQTQEQMQGKILASEVECKRIEEILQEANVDFDAIVKASFVPGMGEILSKVGELKQKRDVITLSLNGYQVDSDKLAFRFEEAASEWQTILSDAKEIDHLIVSLGTSGTIFPSEELLGRPRWMLGMWQEKLTQNAPMHKEGCRHYLTNLKNLLDVKKKMLQEELGYFQEPAQEFQGIDLLASQELFLRYHTQVEEVEAQFLQYGFLVNQMDDPLFEMSSLSSVMHDPVGMEIANRAMNLEILLRDPDNRSTKELQRLESELNLRKDFLKLHLEQTKHLIGLRRDLLKEKIHSLQTASLGAIYGQLSLLEKQSLDLLEAKAQSSLQEKQFYTSEMKRLGEKMTTFPEKWVSEQLMKQKVQGGQNIVAEVRRLVENKNIQANLDLIQSAPVEFAYPPILPNPPLIPFYGLLGFFVGTFGACGYLLTEIVRKGVMATKENLKLANQRSTGPISGSLDHLLDNDLGVLRDIVGTLEGKSTLIALGNGPDYSGHIAQLLAKRGLKVLRITLDFSTSIEDRGLFAFLTDQIDEPIIKKGKNFDTIDACGVTRNGLELVHTDKFLHWLQKMSASYDQIIATIPNLGVDPGVLPFSFFFNQFIVQIHQETLQELEPIFSRKPLFLFYESVP